MYALIENNEIKETFSNIRALKIGDVQYPKNIFTVWSESELNNVGLYTVVFDNSNRKDDSCYTNTDVSYAFADGVATASYGTATPKELLGLKSQKKAIIKKGKAFDPSSSIKYPNVIWAERKRLPLESIPICTPGLR